MRLSEAMAPAFDGKVGYETGVYIRRELARESKDMIRQLARDIGAPLSNEHIKQLHVTVFYGKNQKPPSDLILKENEVKVNIGDLALYDDGKALVVKLLGAQELEQRHKYMRSLGLEHSYPEFNPHVTLTYWYDELMDYQRERIGEILNGNKQHGHEGHKLILEGEILAQAK